MGKRRERVNVCEEVVDEESQHRPRGDGLGIKDMLCILTARDGDERLGGIVRPGTDVWLESLLLGRLGRFCVLVRRTAPLHRPIESAVDAKFDTGLAWLSLVALRSKRLAKVVTSSST